MDNLITEIFNPLYLYILWRSPNEREGFFAVAQIERNNDNSIQLSYLKNTQDFIDAQERGFTGYPAFPDINKTYTENILNIFMRRLPPRKREDFKFYLNQIGLDSNIEIPDFALLAYSRAQLATDDFRLIFSFEGIKVPCEVIAEVVGVRHYKNNFSSIALNNKVTFEPEPDCQYDPNAIQVLYNGKIIGYISKVQAPSFGEILKTNKVSGTIQKLNGTAERPRIFIKISVK